MRNLYFVFLLLFANVGAADIIDSSVSGRFATPNGNCVVVLARGTELGHIDIELACANNSGSIDYSLTRAEGYPAKCVGSIGTATVFTIDGRTLREYVALDSFQGANLHVRRAATPGALYNGGGTAETWRRSAPLASPTPFSCNTRGL